MDCEWIVGELWVDCAHASSYTRLARTAPRVNGDAVTIDVRAVLGGADVLVVLGGAAAIGGRSSAGPLE